MIPPAGSSAVSPTTTNSTMTVTALTITAGPSSSRSAAMTTT